MKKTLTRQQKARAKRCAVVHIKFDLDHVATIGAGSTFVSVIDDEVYAEARRLLRVALAAVRRAT